MIATALFPSILHLTCILVFYYFSRTEGDLQATAVVGISLLCFLIVADITIIFSNCTPVLSRFLRWTFYFQIVAPLSLIYGLLVASRGVLYPFSLYFLLFILLAPALRLVSLGVRGVLEFVISDDSE